MKQYYTEKFYADRVDSLASARKIIPAVLEYIRPNSVVDVGCGTGEFLQVFSEHGISDILGTDGQWVNRDQLRIPEQYFVPAEIDKPLNLGRTFDLAISLEVGEHLPESVAKTFVDNITSLAPVVLFSAAIPMQGGVYHVNEQWPEYWAALFREKGYVTADCIRKKIWDEPDVAFWYAQNSLMFAHESVLDQYPLLREEAARTPAALSRVHPALYLMVSNKYKKAMSKIPLPLRRMLTRSGMYRTS